MQRPQDDQNTFCDSITIPSEVYDKAVQPTTSEPRVSHDALGVPKSTRAESGSSSLLHGRGRPIKYKILREEVRFF